MVPQCSRHVCTGLGRQTPEPQLGVSGWQAAAGGAATTAVVARSRAAAMSRTARMQAAEPAAGYSRWRREDRVQLVRVRRDGGPAHDEVVCPRREGLPDLLRGAGAAVAGRDALGALEEVEVEVVAVEAPGERRVDRRAGVELEGVVEALRRRLRARRDVGRVDAPLDGLRLVDRRGKRGGHRRGVGRVARRRARAGGAPGEGERGEKEEAGGSHAGPEAPRRKDLANTLSPRGRCGGVSAAPLGRLEYLYVASADVERDLAYYRDVLGAEVVWDFREFGTRVAAVRLSERPPLYILAGHRKAPNVLPIFAVDDLAKAEKALRRR